MLLWLSLVPSSGLFSASFSWWPTQWLINSFIFQTELEAFVFQFSQWNQYPVSSPFMCVCVCVLYLAPCPLCAPPPPTRPPPTNTHTHLTLLPVKWVLMMLMLFQGAYPARLKRVLIVTAPLWFKAPFKILRLFIKEKLRDRVSMGIFFSCDIKNTPPLSLQYVWNQRFPL